jgi:hypothetical protein
VKAHADEDAKEPGPPPQADDYRPSVVLGAQDELRLLDEALEEAKARPRPPAAAYAAPLPPVQPGALPRSNGAATRRPRAVNGRAQKLVVETVNGANGGGAHRKVTYGPEPELTFLADLTDELPEPEADEGGRVVIDRKRLLAAIICILQEELTKSTRPTAKTRATGSGRPSKQRPL